MQKQTHWCRFAKLCKSDNNCAKKYEYPNQDFLRSTSTLKIVNSDQRQKNIPVAQKIFLSSSIALTNRFVNGSCH